MTLLLSCSHGGPVGSFQQLSRSAAAAITTAKDWTASTIEMYFLTVLEAVGQDQGTGRFSFWGELSSQLVDTCLLLCHHTAGSEREGSLVLLLMRTLILLEWSPLNDLI